MLLGLSLLQFFHSFSLSVFGVSLFCSLSFVTDCSNFVSTDCVRSVYVYSLPKIFSPIKRDFLCSEQLKILCLLHGNLCFAAWILRGKAFCPRTCSRTEVSMKVTHCFLCFPLASSFSENHCFS